MSTASKSSSVAVVGSKIVAMFEPPESAPMVAPMVTEGMPHGEHRPPATAGFEEMTVDSSSLLCSWSEMSSDLSSGKEEDGGDEADGVQRWYKGPLDSMDELAESLLQRRSLSSYYEGRTKAFVNLADALRLSMSTPESTIKPQ